MYYTLVRTGNRVYLIRADACTQPLGQSRRGEREQMSPFSCQCLSTNQLVAELCILLGIEDAPVISLITIRPHNTLSASLVVLSSAISAQPDTCGSVSVASDNEEHVGERALVREELLLFRGPACDCCELTCRARVGGAPGFRNEVILIRHTGNASTHTRVSVYVRSDLEQIACWSLAPLALLNFSAFQHNFQSNLLINALNCSPSFCFNLLISLLDRFQNSALLLEHFPRAGNTSPDNCVMPCESFTIRGIGTSRLASLIYCFIVYKIDASVRLDFTLSHV